MRIISEGDLDKARREFEFKCKSCGCVFAAYEDECVEYSDHDGIYFSHFFKHDCPCCGKEVNSSVEIPK